MFWGCLLDLHLRLAILVGRLMHYEFISLELNMFLSQKLVETSILERFTQKKKGGHF
jgi:hypothetical protein